MLDFELNAMLYRLVCLPPTHRFTHIGITMAAVRVPVQALTL